jgi:glycosyltransferase involved in cell wall biosynthesis
VRIGIVAPLTWPIPPVHYGGWELVAYELTEGLVRRGHQVTLFATGDARTSARLASIVPHPLSDDDERRRYSRTWEALHAASAFERAAEFDLLHNHLGSFPVCWSRLLPVPLVTTLHGSGAEAESKLIYQRYAEGPYVSISDAERRLVPELHYAATVYNGIDPDRFPFSGTPGDYLLVLGRMSQDKGVHLAIQVAKLAGLPLVLAGIVAPEDERYFAEQIEPHLGGDIRFIGPADRRRKGELYAGALALLHLVTYEEAFGLVMVEAMACGCPVIATPRGSVPELVHDGQTGFIVADVEQAVEAARRVGTLDRAACRRHVQEHFTVDRMVEGYERVYRATLAAARNRRE